MPPKRKDITNRSSDTTKQPVAKPPKKRPFILLDAQAENSIEQTAQSHQPLKKLRRPRDFLPETSSQDHLKQQFEGEGPSATTLAQRKNQDQESSEHMVQNLRDIMALAEIIKNSNDEKKCFEPVATAILKMSKPMKAGNREQIQECYNKVITEINTFASQIEDGDIKNACTTFLEKVESQQQDHQSEITPQDYSAQVKQLILENMKPPLQALTGFLTKLHRMQVSQQDEQYIQRTIRKLIEIKEPFKNQKPIEAQAIYNDAICSISNLVEKVRDADIKDECQTFLSHADSQEKMQELEHMKPLLHTLKDLVSECNQKHTHEAFIKKLKEGIVYFQNEDLNKIHKIHKSITNHINRIPAAKKNNIIQSCYDTSMERIKLAQYAEKGSTKPKAIASIFYRMMKHKITSDGSQQKCLNHGIYTTDDQHKQISKYLTVCNDNLQGLRRKLLRLAYNASDTGRSNVSKRARRSRLNKQKQENESLTQLPR